MFFACKPNDEQINAFLQKQIGGSYSYEEVGATGRQLPSGFAVDSNRIVLGHGETVFLRARQAILDWKMFELGWVELCWPDVAIEAGSTVAILAQHFGFYSLSAARIVYVIDESESDCSRFGFAYGTLQDHLECGEERFTVEWNRSDDSVSYELLAFSKPQQFLVKLGQPVARYMQKRFVRDSQRAMKAE